MRSAFKRIFLVYYHDHNLLNGQAHCIFCMCAFLHCISGMSSYTRLNCSAFIYLLCNAFFSAHHLDHVLPVHHLTASHHRLNFAY